MFKEYAQFDATGLAELIAKRAVSASEVLEAAVARMEAVNPKINAIATPMLDIAEKRASEALEGPFAGVPFLIKDIAQEYAGVRMTDGCRALERHVPTRHASVVQRWLDAGTVIFGITTTPEYALRAATESELFGATRNPWNLDRSPGGSSGGAGAAVAAGIVPMAGASDGGGSIRIPSAYCGLFGLRPGRGRVSSGPMHEELWDGASQVNVVCHSVRDSARMLDVLAGVDPGAQYRVAPPERAYADELLRAPGKLRIGFNTASPIGTPVDPDCVAAVEAAAKLLADLGHHVEPATPAVDGHALARSYLAMYFGHTAAWMAQTRAVTGCNEDAFELETRALGLLGQAMTAGEYVTQRKRWNDYARALGAFHQTYDLYLTPTTAARASRIGEGAMPLAQRVALRAILKLGVGKTLLKSGIVDQLAQQSLQRVPFTQLSNLTGTPSMSVPLGVDREGLPVGVQFIAAGGGEGLLVRLAAQLEQAAPWAGRTASL